MDMIQFVNYKTDEWCSTDNWVWTFDEIYKFVVKSFIVEYKLSIKFNIICLNLIT